MLALVNPASVSMQHFVSEGPVRKICLELLLILEHLHSLCLSSFQSTNAWLHLEVSYIFVVVTTMPIKEASSVK